MKIIIKLSILALLLKLSFLFSLTVFAWFASYGEVLVTISNIDEPFLLELLVPVDEASILTNQEMDDILTDEFFVSSFMNSMNGYVDADYYGSSQLYGIYQFNRTNRENNLFIFNFISGNPSTYKVALIFEDGSILSSPVITQTQYIATILYDGETVTFSESDPIAFPIQLYERDFAYYYNSIMLMIVFIIAIVAVELLVAFHFGYRGIKTSVVLIGLYTSYYLLSTLMQWVREVTMYHQFSLFLPYIMILLVGIFTGIQTKVWIKQFPNQSRLKALIYVIFGNALLIAFSIYGFYNAGGFLFTVFIGS